MNKWALATTLTLAISGSISSSALAHGGRTNSEGCHNDRSNGSYHCHNNGNKRKSADKKSQKKYIRKDWPHWVDDDQDCQNTRAEILIRDSSIPVKFKRNKGCSVTWGKWHDPFTGITFTKASDIDIDHIVPLAHAHSHGAANWSRAEKRKFANDPENLLSVEDYANQAKGAQPPQYWMPENRSYHCQYIKKWKNVKDKYGLRFSKRELNKINNILARCN